MPADTRFSDLALRHLGDRARRPKMVRLNGLKAGESVTVGDRFLLPPR
ncbi:MAG: hypothetical protein OXC91_13510 [Rhodobacteraceae bacterium]|nr:hypothetical protein [Paracoccaceae bacterium]